MWDIYEICPQVSMHPILHVKMRNNSASDLQRERHMLDPILTGCIIISKLISNNKRRFTMNFETAFREYLEMNDFAKSTLIESGF